jgi:hypothetical protein
MNLISSQLLTSASFAVILAWINNRRRQARNRSKKLREEIYLSGRAATKLIKRSQTWDDLPKVVQNYLRKVLPKPRYSESLLVVPRAIYIRQKGQILVDSKWLPFVADQFLSAYPQGFVWEATVSSLNSWLAALLPKIHVCDAWVGGKGHLEATLGDVVTIASASEKHSNEVLEGEMLRWLAELAILPTALTPEAGLVTWSHGTSENDATLATVDPSSGKNVHLKATFDTETGLLTSVEGERPRAKGNAFESCLWKGYFSNYRLVDDLMVPSRLECCWINNNQESFYFKGDNTMVDFIWMEMKGTSSST